jgi:hypothetical protein
MLFGRITTTEITNRGMKTTFLKKGRVVETIPQERSRKTTWRKKGRELPSVLGK